LLFKGLSGQSVTSEKVPAVWPDGVSQLFAFITALQSGGVEIVAVWKWVVVRRRARQGQR
jgi:hypothetical protein